MAAGDANAWARLRLVQGTSTRSSWDLSSAEGERRVTVGSHPSCQWVIDDSSVDAMHLVLHWDEVSLSVARANDLASVRLDGQPVGPAFVRVGGRARLEFGRCAIVAETSAGGVRLSQAPPPSSNPPQPNLAKTLMGVPLAGALSGQGSSPQSSVKISRAVHAGSSAPPASAQPGDVPAELQHNKVPRGTVEGLGPVVAAVHAAPKGGAGASDGRRDASQHDPLASTRYGMGDDVRAHAVDFVSPERLRRSSVPPGPAAELGPARRPNKGGAEAGPRATQFGFSEAPGHAAFVESRPSDTGPSEDKRLVDDTDQIRQLSELRDHPVVARTRRLTPARFQANVVEPEGRPRPSSTRPPTPGRSPMFTIVVTVAALLGLGAWVYALTTL